MNQLTLVRVEGTLGLFEYQAPDRLQGWDSSDVSWCLIGKQYWYRDPAEGWGNWHVRHENRKAFKWPDFTRFTGTATRDGFFDREATEARNVRFLAGHEYGGLPAYVIGYDIDAMTIEGPVLVEQIEWIAKDSLLLLARETANNDPWGDPEPTFESYSEFDESAPLDCVGAALTAVP